MTNLAAANVSGPLIAGVDSSTQSTKVELRDQSTGTVVGFGSSAHPAVKAPRSEQDPRSWLSAFDNALIAAQQSVDGNVADATVAAVSIGGQQHGMVALDVDGQPVHPAKLWNDSESADDADWLIDHFDGGFPDAVGSLPVAAFTVTKLSWLHRTHPEAWQKMSRVMLPHDYVTAHLTGEFTTDRGDASGTGYWSPSAGEYRWDILELIDGARDWSTHVPSVLGPLDVAGRWNAAVVAPGTGDNMAGALGVGLRPGDAVISVGTSGTVYAVSEEPTSDPSGTVAGFADATGRFLPLVCTSNAAKVLDAVRRLLDVDHAEFDRLALAALADGTVGPTLLPYLDGERTPNRPDARGLLAGITSEITRGDLALSATSGVVCGLLDGLDAMTNHAQIDGRIVLTGGGTRSVAVQQMVAALTGRTVIISDAAEAVATGAAVQAAAVLEQVEHSVIQDRWGLGGGAPVELPEIEIDRIGIRERYAQLRDGS